MTIKLLIRLIEIIINPSLWFSYNEWVKPFCKQHAVYVENDQQKSLRYKFIIWRQLNRIRSRHCAVYLNIAYQIYCEYELGKRAIPSDVISFFERREILLFVLQKQVSVFSD